MSVSDLVLWRNILSDIEEIKQKSIEMFVKTDYMNDIEIYHY